MSAAKNLVGSQFSRVCLVGPLSTHFLISLFFDKNIVMGAPRKGKAFAGEKKEYIPAKIMGNPRKEEGGNHRKTNREIPEKEEGNNPRMGPGSHAKS